MPEWADGRPGPVLTPLSKPGYLYEIENLATGARYVGQSIAPSRRIKQHLKCSSNARLRHAVLKHGSTVFSGRILPGQWDTQEELDTAEIAYIETITLLGFDRYNISEGGGRNDSRSGNLAFIMRLRHDDELKRRYKEMGRNLNVHSKLRGTKTRIRVDVWNDPLFEENAIIRRENLTKLLIAKTKCKEDRRAVRHRIVLFGNLPPHLRGRQESETDHER